MLNHAIRFLDAVIYTNLQKIGSFLQILRHDFELRPFKPGKLADVHV
ncbi:hypothetical protein L532_5272 [Bordetella bronchiseptica OSU095]|uniref:Uncharacterized protein n=1 Tax=Bordetella bronchiseptica 00-P-2796 TaxID=1331199 RepID=A0ABR4RKP0_BORBO|nr:hypothetical protein L576_0075 [Bordetella bronchiseptica OSU054]KCV38322.1 hypothetical protein L490_5368 [Bordetella bronchiseptica 00-P-2796]KDD45612.1 hypothetical protein L532_5272 [Bordetella bronchiseptica OSU095]